MRGKVWVGVGGQCGLSTSALSNKLTLLPLKPTPLGIYIGEALAIPEGMIIETKRLRLLPFDQSHREGFTTMNTDPEVMADLGGPFAGEKSDAKLARYAATFEDRGFGRFAIENSEGRFLGYAGIMPVDEAHPLGPHVEIGWRLLREAWGHGYATEAAAAALQDGFGRVGLTKIFSYTAPENFRSQAVMERLQLHRDRSSDFVANYGSVKWHGLVWVATTYTNGS